MTTGGNNRKFRALLASPGQLAWCGCLVALLVIAAGLATFFVRRPEQRFHAALRAVKQGNYDLARHLALRMEGTPAGDARAGLIEGAIALRRRRLNEVFEPLQRARSAGELLPEVLSLEGEALLLSGRQEEAATALTLAIDAAPDLAEPYQFLGALHYDLGNLEQAATHLERAAKLAPRSPGPSFLLGHMFLEANDFVRAETHLRESLRRSPWQTDRPVILQELAQAQLAQGRPRDARETLSLCEPSPAIDSLMARCYRVEGEPSEALKYAQHVLSSVPYDGEMLMLVGTIALEQGDGERAFDAHSRAVEAFPRSEAARRGFAASYRLLGEPQRADEEEKIADEIHAQWEKYRTLAEEAAHDPINADKRFELAELARQLGDAQAALMWMQEVLRIDPDHGPARSALNPSDVDSEAVDSAPSDAGDAR